MSLSISATHIESIFLWGLIATLTMAVILQGSQGLGLSRLSMPFLFGTLFTANRDYATIVGFLVYVIGGWVLAFGYFMIFIYIDAANWWIGALIGFLQGLVVLIVMLPLLPYIHPRMATEYEGPTATRRLEPPGFMGLNYGYRTPLITLIGHTCYGTILGAFYRIPENGQLF